MGSGIGRGGRGWVQVSGGEGEGAFRYRAGRERVGSEIGQGGSGWVRIGRPTSQLANGEGRERSLALAPPCTPPPPPAPPFPPGAEVSRVLLC